MEKEQNNTRVLIIDDEEIVRDSIEDILIPLRLKKNEKISSASSILFDDDDPDQPVLTAVNNFNIPAFSVDKAVNGMEGLEKIKVAIAETKPYAVIFLDMRMPGWDGLETALNIRRVDNKAEIIIITAFSDRSIEDIVTQLGQNVGYHCKPYASEEILQLATKAVSDYNKLRNLENLIAVISNINVSKSHLDSLLQNILDQLAMYIGSDLAVLGKLLKLGTDQHYQQLFYIGSVEKQINVNRLSAIISSAHINNEEVIQIDELVFVKIDDYYIFAALKREQHLKTEKLYLLKLFVQSAGKAIKNAVLQEAMMQQEKLSAVGKALSMLMHDLRTPIKNIPLLTSAFRDEGVSSEWLDMIDLCGEQASEIFDDFLDFVRETPLSIQRIQVEPLVLDAIGLADNRSEIKPIRITQQIEQGLSLMGDRSKLKRVLMNLLSNAVDVLKDRHVNQPSIDIVAKSINNVIVIKISDNGPGIPDAVMENLFDAFVTSGKSNGTGLGLAIVKQYVQSHGGTITVVNNPGAEFTITLPAAPNEVA